MRSVIFFNSLHSLSITTAENIYTSYTMLFNIIVVSSLLAVIDSASAAADPTPYMMAMSSENNPFGILKRQGYQPTETSCGPGTTCAESCGVGSEACDFGNNPSPAFNFYCYNPTEGEICCPNRMGRKRSLTVRVRQLEHPLILFFFVSRFM